jgi:hypothetical protein
MDTQKHNYAKLYSKYFMKYLNKKSLNIAEIGILTGIGLAIWCDVFDSSNIYGFDIDTRIYNNNLNNLQLKGAFTKTKPNVFSLDQFNDNNDYIKECSNNKKFNIVIDDGCHLDEAIIKTFTSFIDNLETDFTYVIEDNVNVHKKLKKMYPNYNIHYNNQLTIITPK